jgi:hypothetical protein
MNKLWNNRLTGLFLVLSSIMIYYIQVVLFRDARNTLYYLFQDLAFLPLQVFIVTSILERILNARQKSDLKRKMNVVISAFYSEVGIQALSAMTEYVQNAVGVKRILDVSTNWKEEDFKAAIKEINSFQYEIRSENADLELLSQFLLEKRPFMLSLFENTNLFEHDTFTDMLWAVFHVTEELGSRDTLVSLPPKDLEHLSIDIKRAYQFLIVEWLYYMNHLKKEYPYLFSLAVRKSPFNENGSVIIN